MRIKSLKETQWHWIKVYYFVPTVVLILIIFCTVVVVIDKLNHIAPLVNGPQPSIQRR